MKLVIQIPAWNEETHLPATLAALPRQVPGFDRVEVQVVDDGSSDRTAEVARDHDGAVVVQLATHRGLAVAFAAGLVAALAARRRRRRQHRRGRPVPPPPRSRAWWRRSSQARPRW